MSSCNGDGGVTEWFEHWSTMFPFGVTLTEEEKEAAAVERPSAASNRTATLVQDLPWEQDSPQHRLHQRELRQDLRRIEATFQKHLSSISGDNKTIRTSYSSASSEEDDAWDTSRNFSFTSRTLQDSDDAFDGIILSYDSEGDDPKLDDASNRIKRSKKRGARSSRRRGRSLPRKVRYSYCDTTTKYLAILVVVLSVVVILLGALAFPRRNRNSNTGSNLTDNGQQPQDQPGVLLPPDTTPDQAAAQPPSLRPKPRPSAAPGVDSQPTWPPSYPSNPDEGYFTPAPTTATAIVPPVQQPVVVAPSPPPTRPTNPDVPPPPVPPLSMGPLVGHTTHNSAMLWAYHASSYDKMELVLYDEYDTVLAVEFIQQDTRKLDQGVFVHTLNGLRPSTLYKYGMHLQGQRVGQGQFTTAPLPESSSKFDYVLASCMNARQYRDQRVWSHIVSNNNQKYPDFSILAGDTVYLQEGVDVTEEQGVILDRVWFRNQEQRDDPYFKNFIARVPTYATWNDHEYGKNNASKDQKGKENSWRAWRNLWVNPGYGDEQLQDGIYYSFHHGDVHFIVTDDQWFRDFGTRNRLGEKQTEWLRNELVSSTATFKVIVIGSDIMERGWESDLYNIGRIVTDNRIEGVLFNAGDVHRNEFKSMDYEGSWPYKVTQITSSGIARVWRRPYVHIKVDTQAADPTMTAHFYGATSTADDATWRNDPNLQCSSIVGTDRQKEHTCTETVRLSALQFQV